MRQNSFLHKFLTTATVAAVLFIVGCSKSPSSKDVANSPSAGEASAPQTGTATAKLNSEDKEFFANAAKDAYADIQLARTALNKTHDQDVQAFAQKIVDDHQKMNGDLAQLASAKGVTLPDSASLASAIKQGALKFESGTHFDRSFLQRIIKGHEDAIQMFEKEANGGLDTEVKDLAITTISNLKGHLASAQELINKLNARKGAKG